MFWEAALLIHLSLSACRWVEGMTVAGANRCSCSVDSPLVDPSFQPRFPSCLLQPVSWSKCPSWVPMASLAMPSMGPLCAPGCSLLQHCLILLHAAFCFLTLRNELSLIRCFLPLLFSALSWLYFFSYFTAAIAVVLQWSGSLRHIGEGRLPHVSMCWVRPLWGSGAKTTEELPHCSYAR